MTVHTDSSSHLHRHPEIHPCLAELLRTCSYPPSLALRIDKIQVEDCDLAQRESSPEEDSHVPDLGRRKGKACRLSLSDGVLVLQALLENRLLQSVSLEECVVGNTILLKRFGVRRARKLDGKGEVVFLGIQDCEFVASGMTTQRAEGKKKFGGEDIGHVDQKGILRTKRVKFAHPSSHLAHVSSEAVDLPLGRNDAVEDSDSDDFETSTFDQPLVESRRRALQKLNGDRSTPNGTDAKIPNEWNELGPERPLERDSRLPATGSPARRTAIQAVAQLKPNHSPPQLMVKRYHPENVPPAGKSASQTTTTTRATTITPHHVKDNDDSDQQDSKPAQTRTNNITANNNLLDPPYHSLLSLEPGNQPPHQARLPTKSYHCTIFAIISWISPSLLRPRPYGPRPGPGPEPGPSNHGPSFPPKRHIKIHDPSITNRHAGTTVAVYCDAANFLPTPGTVALFRDLVMQTTVAGDVILNAYQRSMSQPGIDGVVGRWVETDRLVLRRLGWDVDALEGWWERRRRERARPRT